MESQTNNALVVHRVIAFSFVGEYVIHIQFDDGTEQVIDFDPILYGPIFGPLREPTLFNEAQLDPDFGALVWPNGADIDPMVLYDWSVYANEIIARRQLIHSEK